MAAISKAQNGLLVNKLVVYLTLSFCISIFLVVGLLCGFLARNTCPKGSTDPVVTVPSTTTRQPDPSPATRTLPLLTTQPTSPPTTTPPLDPEKYRLPGNIVPVNYNLDIKVFFDPIVLDSERKGEEKFEGRAVITMRVLNSTRVVVFHCDPGLLIQKDTVEITNLQTNQVIVVRSEQHYYDDNQFYKIELDEALGLGEYTLRLDYRGDFGPSSNLDGFYKTTYIEDLQLKQIVATDFEPLDARRAYPCFDEPGYKATYEIAIEHPMNTIALSNWPESPRESVDGNRYRTTFAKTFPMATYLAAWVVIPDDFGVVLETSQRGTPIRILARRSAADKGLLTFAAEVAKKAVDFFQNDYFDSTLNAVPPKIDHIALPEFSAGAMENWGLVMYRETALLFSDDQNSQSNKQYVAEIIAHELSHFWFGNLVTCKWWDEIWLNEAMAQFLQNKAINAIYPDWDLENQFITTTLIPVMFDDGIQSTVPIENPVLTPTQIGAVFNSITYSKGASVLRMLESIVGKDNFQQGLNAYLKQNEFGSAVSTAFYNTLVLPSDMTDTTPQEFMNTWIKQTNFPEVGVVVASNSQGNTRVIFGQRRFLFSPEVLPDIDFPSPYGFQWQIYLRCRAGGISPNQHTEGNIIEFSYFLRGDTGQIDLDRRYSWVKCNNDFKGFYVLDYSIQLLAAFDDILAQNKDIFSIADRANIIHSTFTLAYIGRKSYATVSFLASYIEYNENQYVPWRTFTYHISKIASLLDHRPAFRELKDFAIALTTRFAEEINVWDNSGTPLEKLLKTSLIDFLCRMQDEEYLRRASDVYRSLNSFYFIFPGEVENTIPPYLRDIAYKYHLQNTYVYNDFLDVNGLYGLSVDAQERSQALTAMSYPRIFWILDLVLESLIEPNPAISSITKQDFFAIINAISRNPSGRYMAWWFIRNHWYDIQDIVGYRSRGLANTVKTVCETFENEFLLEQMNFFFSTTEPGVGSAQRQTALEIVSHNIYWVKDREPDIVANLFEPRRMKKN